MESLFTFYEYTYRVLLDKMLIDQSSVYKPSTAILQVDFCRWRIPICEACLQSFPQCVSIYARLS